ncbi:MAG: ECF transporter S component [Clostridiales bacterium]|nr:ECF transporter S component [Clostridiales bacterium]
MKEEKVESSKIEGAGTRSERKKGLSVKERFTAKRLALMGVFVALSYAVSFLEIPLPLFGASFLKLDFGNVFIALIAFLLGPIEGVIVCFLKESLRMFGGTVVGELANMIMTCSFILFPAIVYRYKKGFKTVVFSLCIACLIGTGVSLLANRFIIFPLYEAVLEMSAQEAFSIFWIAVLIFNLIKTVAVGLFTVLLYKRLSNFLKKLKI